MLNSQSLPKAIQNRKYYKEVLSLHDYFNIFSNSLSPVFRYGFRTAELSGGSVRRPGCRPTRQASLSQAPWQRATLSVTTWREGPSLITPTPPWSLRGQQPQLQPPPSQVWPLHLTTVQLHLWQLHLAWVLFSAQQPCFATLPSLDPPLAGMVHIYISTEQFSHLSASTNSLLDTKCLQPMEK